MLRRILIARAGGRDARPGRGGAPATSRIRWSSDTAAPPGTCPTTRCPATRWRSSSAPTSSSRTWSRPRTGTWSPATSPTSPPRPTWPSTPSSPTASAPRRSTACHRGLVRLRLHAQGAAHAARGAAAPRAPAAVQRQVPHPHVRGSHRARQALLEALPPHDRHLSRDQAPDLPQEHRAAAGAQARQGARQGRPQSSPLAVFIQSFETSNLKRLNKMTPVRLVQLIDANDVNPDGSLDYTAPFDRPYDWTASGRPRHASATSPPTPASTRWRATPTASAPGSRTSSAPRPLTSTATARSATRTATAS